LEKKKRKKSDEFVIDSSVVAKWFLNENGSDIAIGIRDRFATNQVGLSIPTLLLYEVMNALRYGGNMSESDLVVASKSLSKYQFEIWRPLGSLLESSAKISLKKDLTLYDAVYVALAQRKGTRLITEDKELLGKFPRSTIPLKMFSEVAASPSSNTPSIP
jgi:predicted nucleic acid-binding protein